MTLSDDFGVSRETTADLTSFADLLVKWNGSINLISPKSVEELWTRHIADSVQLFDQANRSSGVWGDLGTGGGFPGLVCAILAKRQKPHLNFVLVESDTRKALFLRTAIRELRLNGRVENGRIEKIAPLEADILSARALAPLDKLLEFASIHLSKDGVALFMKGANYQNEIQESLAKWRYQVQKTTSKTDSTAAILKIKEVERV